MATDLSEVGVTAGVPDAGTGTVPSLKPITDAFGVQADAASTATDTTPASAMSIFKQLSASLQILAAIDFSTESGGNLDDVAALLATIDADTGNLGAILASLAGMETDIETLASGSIEPGTAGSPSTDVLTIQGDASMTPVKTYAGVRTDVLMNDETALTPKFAVITASATGATAVVAAVSGKKIRVIAWDVVANDAVNFKWQSASTDKTGLYYMAGQGGGVARSYNPAGYFETAATEALNINLSTAVAVGGSLVYVEV